jgi:alpha-L-fucosidase
VTTQKGDRVYVHVLHWNAPLLALPPFERKITGADMLGGGAVEFTQSGDGVVVKVPAGKEVDRVVVLRLAGK